MEISVRRKQGVTILDLAGRIDVDSAILVETVGYLIHNGEMDILCNFEEVEFIDYTGISVIAVAYKEVVNNNGRIKFVNIPAHLRGIFSISGLDRTFEIFPSEDLGVNSFREDRIIEKIKRRPLRRRFKRLSVRINVEYRPVTAKKEEEFMRGQMLDLSAVGAYIMGPNKFSLNDMLDLRLHLKPKPGEMNVEARVVWLSDKQIQPQFHPGMGVEFYNLSTSAQKRIMDFIDRNLTFSATNNI
ncbi:MAG: anti-sigma factor antagonist [Candidatus Omnitrophica bacterium]|nr:anti-sigma factor antagonist [Candidatus Omnitrophota bacterium]